MGATVHSINRRPQPFMARYGIARCLGRGAIDAVYEGVRRGTNERVVVRRTHPHLVDERVRHHVVKHARVGTAVFHHNVIRIEEVADLEGDLFVVTKHVEGVSLARLLARKPLPQRIAMRIALDACAGLGAIHAARAPNGARLVHGDVSPSNIIVGVDGVARIADFGVAKQLEDVDDAAPIRPGKSSYVAPETICTGRSDAESDVFAMGMVLWELFAGRRLWATDEEVLHRALFEDVPSLVAFDVPIAVAAVVARAVARPASYRYSCASLLEVELDEAAKGKIASHAEVALFVEALDAPVDLSEQDNEPTRIIDMKALLEDESDSSHNTESRTG